MRVPRMKSRPARIFALLPRNDGLAEFGGAVAMRCGLDATQEVRTKTCPLFCNKIIIDAFWALLLLLVGVQPPMAMRRDQGSILATGANQNLSSFRHGD